MARLVTTPLALAFALTLVHGAACALGPAHPFAPPVQTTATPAQPEALPAGVLLGVRFGAAPAALIDGQWIRLGQPVRGARLAAVRPTEVVLQHPDGRAERLGLPNRPSPDGPVVITRTVP